SSKRLHTILSRDWSSDVCSSDLELEYIDGKIFANIYLTDKIIIINPENGQVEGELNMIGLLPQKDQKPDTDVLNGIAYDRQNKRIFVTGKKWNTLFEIKLLER